MGVVPGFFARLLALRGVRTLDLRMDHRPAAGTPVPRRLRTPVS